MRQRFVDDFTLETLPFREKKPMVGHSIRPVLEDGHENRE